VVPWFPYRYIIRSSNYVRYIQDFLHKDIGTGESWNQAHLVPFFGVWFPPLKSLAILVSWITYIFLHSTSRGIASIFTSNSPVCLVYRNPTRFTHFPFFCIVAMRRLRDRNYLWCSNTTIFKRRICNTYIISYHIL
jgi:hypothetical protein